MACNMCGRNCGDTCYQPPVQPRQAGGPYVIRHPDGTFLQKKDTWKVTWTTELNAARLFPTEGAVTRAKGTLNDGYKKPINVDVDVLQVKVVLA